jgi:hypothetical protein
MWLLDHGNVQHVRTTKGEIPEDQTLVILAKKTSAGLLTVELLLAQEHIQESQDRNRRLTRVQMQAA